MKLSVMIPVYNGKKYLGEAIESVLSQPVKDLEIIVVDDGSSDGTAELCDSYAREYENIVVLHQKNQGVSAARNQGILRAQGDYLLFLDADDRFVKNAVDQDMIRSCEQGYDVIMYSSLASNAARRRYRIDMAVRDQIVPGGRALPISGHFGSCLYRRKMLLDHHVYFDEGIRLNEDEAFKMKAMYAAELIQCRSRFLYIYSTTPGSARYTERHIYDLVLAWEKASEWLDRYGQKGDVKQAQAYIQQKRWSRLLLYSKLLIQQGYSGKELRQELERLRVYDGLRTLPVNYMIPGQRNDLLLFQENFAGFVRAARIEGAKLFLGRLLLKAAPVRYIRDLKRMPWNSTDQI